MAKSGAGMLQSLVYDCARPMLSLRHLSREDLEWLEAELNAVPLLSNPQRLALAALKLVKGGEINERDRADSGAVFVSESRGE